MCGKSELRFYNKFILCIMLVSAFEVSIYNECVYVYILYMYVHVYVCVIYMDACVGIGQVNVCLINMDVCLYTYECMSVYICHTIYIKYLVTSPPPLSTHGTLIYTYSLQ